MFSYLQSPFLQALGYAIANSLWQVFLLWLIVVLANGMAKQSSHIKYITAASAQIAAFVWFATTFQFYYRHCVLASAEANQLMLQNLTVHQSFTTGSGALSFLAGAEQAMPYLSLSYLIMLAILTTKWIQNFRHTKQLSNSGVMNADSKWQSFVNEMADRLQIVQDVKIYFSSLAKSPLTIGYIKPIILLPVASINHLSIQQTEAIILHELAHIKRSDYLINLLVSITEIILFFNPFARLLSRMIEKERENSCDDHVLYFQYDATMYADALFRIACFQKTNNFEMSAASQNKGDLLKRVKRLVQPAEKTFSYKHQLAALSLITGLLFSIAWLQPTENRYARQQTSAIKKTDTQIVAAPLLAQVNNPFFNVASLFSKSLQKEVSQSLAEVDQSVRDSMTIVGSKPAQKALAEAAKVVETVTSANWQKIMANATKEAANSLEKIDRTSLQNAVPQMVDSSFIAETITNALRFNDNNEASVKAGLAAAKAQLARLQSENFDLYFNNAYLQQVTANAFASLKNFDFKKIEDSIFISNENVKKVFSEQKKQWLQMQKKRQQIKEMQEHLKKSANLLYSQTEPSVLLPPLPPENNNMMIYTSDEFPAPEFDQSVSTWSFPEPVTGNIINKNKVLKTIHIINHSDSATVNIVIEIRQ